MTLRSKVNVVSGSMPMSNRDHICTWQIVSCWYTHVQNMISQCQTHKKLCAGHESAQTDGQTDRVISIYPMNFVHGGINTRKIKIINVFAVAFFTWNAIISVQHSRWILNFHSFTQLNDKLESFFNFYTHYFLTKILANAFK